jgi:hypothetical protein
MIRQQVTRHGVLYPLPPATELPACTVPREAIGAVKSETVRKWLDQKKVWDLRYRKTIQQIREQRLKNASLGYACLNEGETPPPSALVARQCVDESAGAKKVRVRSLGLTLWSGWGSKHDRMTVQREVKAEGSPEVNSFTSSDHGDIDLQREGARSMPISSASQGRSKRRIVRYESQVEEIPTIIEDTAVAALLSKRRLGRESSIGDGLLSPNHNPDTGICGKRPHIDGIAMPFSLGKDADTASMLTLTSTMDQVPSGQSTPGPGSPVTSVGKIVDKESAGDDDIQKSVSLGQPEAEDTHKMRDEPDSPPYLSPLSSPALQSPELDLERFMTADDRPKIERPAIAGNEALEARP